VIRAAALAAATLFVARLAVPLGTQLDHLVAAIRSLDEGLAQFEALTGVKAGVGGRHPGRGTENALVSLGGGSYLEILAPLAGAKLSADDERMRGLARLTIIDWAVRVPDVDAAVSALEDAGFATSAPQPGARLTPSGERLDWMTFGLAGARDGAPFFIRWSPNARHPSTTAPPGCSLERLMVTDPAADRLCQMLQAVNASGVAVSSGTRLVEARLACGAVRATLSSAPR